MDFLQISLKSIESDPHEKLVQYASTQPSQENQEPASSSKAPPAQAPPEQQGEGTK